MHLLHYLASNFWWPFVAGVLFVAVPVAAKTAWVRAGRWFTGRRT